MLVVVTERGPLARALESEARRRGWDVVFASPDDDDLFMKALDQRAVVYVAAPTVLSGIVDPAPDVGRVAVALSAANAPGVEVLVAVFPGGDAYTDEKVAIRKYGKPYVMVELPLVLEELGEAMDGDGAESIWVPNSGRVLAVRARKAARAVLDASVSELQGQVHVLDAKPLDARALFARAANAVGRELSVHAVAPALHRAVRPLAKWIRGGEPKALALADRLLLPPAPRAREAPLWPPFVFPPGDPLAILPGEWFAPGANDRGRESKQDSAA